MKKASKEDAVKNMMKSFDSLWEQGLTMKNIAQKFNVSVATLYNKLEEIAKMNGKTREDYRRGQSNGQCDEQTVTLHVSSKTNVEEIQKVKEDISTAICECNVLVQRAKALANENNKFLTNEEENNNDC